jgi:hypothetical protein
MKVKLECKYFDLQGSEISFNEWLKIMTGPNRVLKQSQSGPYTITTRFVGVKSKNNPPMLFETFIRRIEQEDQNEFRSFQAVASSRDGAMKNHEEAQLMIERSFLSRPINLK